MHNLSHLATVWVQLKDARYEHDTVKEHESHHMQVHHDGADCHSKSAVVQAHANSYRDMPRV